jgi:hypothetical protein
MLHFLRDYILETEIHSAHLEGLEEVLRGRIFLAVICDWMWRPSGQAMVWICSAMIKKDALPRQRTVRDGTLCGALVGSVSRPGPAGLQRKEEL